MALALAALLSSALGATHKSKAAAATVPNPNCSLVVPAAPLTAAGLATPYQLTATNPEKGACREASPTQSAFVQATVLDPATGTVSVYNPLVVDRGATPARPPVVPKLPAGAVVGIWFGFNGANLTLRGAGAAAGCVNGAPGSVFGQFAYCNAPAFFSAAGTAVSDGRLKVPALGLARDGSPCPTTRDFGLVDQDQSDNVTTVYLDRDGRTAQRTAANEQLLGGDTVRLTNASDNLLLTAFVDPALGCTPWTAPDLADPGRTTTSLALDEIQASSRQMSPIALVPRTDPMVLRLGTELSAMKTDLYRAGVGQPLLGAVGSDAGDGAAYCANLTRVAMQRLRLDRPAFEAARSPMPGQNLYVFLKQRLQATEKILGCRHQMTPRASTAAMTSEPGPVAPVAGATFGAAGRTVS